ncbi:MAG: thiol-disulfide oxidoreductase DCC family protein [Gemmataceae bacterium]
MPPIVLFDGVCRFCDGGVNWLIDRDPAGRLRFAALQSAAGQRLLTRFGLPAHDFDTMVLVEGERFYTRSTAVLRIAGHLGLPWKLGAAFLLMPAFLRDPLYGLVAANRYRLFGTLDACRVPTPEFRARFLD